MESNNAPILSAIYNRFFIFTLTTLFQQMLKMGRELKQ
jgi:hypothetical protein